MARRSVIWFSRRNRRVAVVCLVWTAFNVRFVIVFLFFFILAIFRTYGSSRPPDSRQRVVPIGNCWASCKGSMVTFPHFDENALFLANTLATNQISRFHIFVVYSAEVDQTDSIIVNDFCLPFQSRILKWDTQTDYLKDNDKWIVNWTFKNSFPTSFLWNSFVKLSLFRNKMETIYTLEFEDCWAHYMITIDQQRVVFPPHYMRLPIRVSNYSYFEQSLLMIFFCLLLFSFWKKEKSHFENTGKFLNVLVL